MGRRGMLWVAPAWLAAWLAFCPAAGLCLEEGAGEVAREVADLSLAGETVWSGKVLVRGTVDVGAGASLELAPGTELRFSGGGAKLLVSGRLSVRGERGREVVLAAHHPEGGQAEVWPGLEIAAGAQVLVENCRISGAATGATVLASSPVFRNTVFEGNQTAVDAAKESRVLFEGGLVSGASGLLARLNSTLRVRGCRFVDCTNAALGFGSGSGGEVRDCTFRGGGAGVMIQQGRDLLLTGNEFDGCDTGVVVDQVGQDVRLSGNSFRGGKLGINCRNFATPWIACGNFREQESGVLVGRFSNPTVVHCLFEGNKQGVYANQKSDFPIEYNIFRNNRTAVFLDMSAYPRINRNNFEGNEKDLVLGEYMSADWEAKVGSRGLSAGQARTSGSHNLAEVLKDRAFTGIVDASGNWWGKAATSLMAAAGGAAANIPSIEDGRDKPTVSYPDFGEGEYKLDTVEYRPWAEGPVMGAGPRPEGCGETPRPR